MNSNLGIGVIVGAVATFLAGSYLLSNEGAQKANDVLNGLKQNENLKSKAMQLLKNQLK